MIHALPNSQDATPTLDAAKQNQTPIVYTVRQAPMVMIYMVWYAGIDYNSSWLRIWGR